MSQIDRKFDVWEVRTDDQRTHQVEVRYKRGERTGTKTVFYVKHKNPDFTLEDGDLDRLRQTLNERLAEFNKIEWKPMLMLTVGETGVPIMKARVNVNMPKVFDGGVALLVGSYEQGVAADGQKFWRVKCRYTGREDAQGVKWSIERGEPWVKEEDETLGQRANEYAVIILDDTPQIRQKLQDACDALDGIRKTMAQIANRDDFVSVLLKGKGVPALLLKDKA